MITHHISKGETVAQSLKDRFDYGQNPEKTQGGELISAYECDHRTADAEFLLAKAKYKAVTGREQRRDADVLCYQIRQSFRPGEITPEEANRVGYETAMRWTKGKHAFFVATHTDRQHIHKITKILNEKSRLKIFARVENSVYITWHRHRIIFSFLYFFLRLIVVWGPPTETAYKKTVGLAAVLLCASNRGRSQTAVLKLIISRPPLFYTHGGKGGTPCFFALSMPLICQKKPRHRTRIF